VGAVVVRDGKSLVIKRAHEPRKGEWSLPGGLLELGESLQDAVRREIKEETSLDIDVGPIIETFDRVHHDDQGKIRYHFVIVDFLCWASGGDAVPGSDAEAVAWVTAAEIDDYGIKRARESGHPARAELSSTGMTLSRDAAWQLLTEWTQGESLRKHALAVEAAVRGYARQQGATRKNGPSSRCCMTSTTSGIRRSAIIRTRAASICVRSAIRSG
jgi:ADP-ribose pyrophosphatase YjhB (NUDIX family)